MILSKNDVKEDFTFICTFNLGSAYEEALRQNCISHNCPGGRKWQHKSICKHEILSCMDIAKKKRELWEDKIEGVIKLTHEVSLCAFQHCEFFFQALFQNRKPDFNP